MRILFFVIALSGIILFNSCGNRIFVDENLLDEWTLQWYEDVNGNKIHIKPDSLPKDILLVFRQDEIISGNIASFNIDGTYEIDKTSSMSLTLSYPELPVCCQWDRIFLEAYPTINSYLYEDGNFLKLYYDNSNKVMLLSK